MVWARARTAAPRSWAWLAAAAGATTALPALARTDVTPTVLMDWAAARAVEAGCTRAASAAEAVTGAEAVVTMLPAGKHVAGVYESDVFPNAAPGTLLLDCSTIDVATARANIEAATAKGLVAVDAPVSGAAWGAAAAELVFMVGGEADAVQRVRPLLERMGRDVGAVQIQARGTLGGNLATASPAADGVAALAAYDATIVLHSVRGERKIALADLQTGYKKSLREGDEVITAVEIALPEKGAPWFWRKVGARRAQAISKVAVAGVAVVEQGFAVRFGLGMASVGPVTAQLWNTRALVQSKPLRELGPEELDAAVASDITPIDDVRSTALYRRHAFARVLATLLAEPDGAPACPPS